MAYGFSFYNTRLLTPPRMAVVVVEEPVVNSEFQRVYNILQTIQDDGQPVRLETLLSNKVPDELRQFVRDTFLRDVPETSQVSEQFKDLTDDDLLALSLRHGETVSQYSSRVQSYLDNLNSNDNGT